MEAARGRSSISRGAVQASALADAAVLTLRSDAKFLAASRGLMERMTTWGPRNDDEHRVPSILHLKGRAADSRAVRRPDKALGADGALVQ
jgi:hypothetical protein